MTRGRRSEPSPALAIVLDENIAAEELRSVLAEPARAHNARVELIMDHFERGTPDEAWMPVAAERGWAVITCDVHLKKRPAEKVILMRAGVAVYILRGALSGDQIRDALLAALPAICRRHRQLAPPIICHVSRDGDVTVMEGKRRGGIKR
jgi:hypothetical protein